MDVKAPFVEAVLPLDNGPSPSNNWERPQAKLGFRHSFVSYCINLTVSLTLFFLAITLWPRNIQVQPSFRADDTGGIIRHGDNDLNFTKRDLLHFDMSVPPYAPISESISIYESLDSCHFSWNATGKLKLVRGETDQRHNFMIGIDVSASSQMALDTVVWDINHKINGLFIRCVEFETPRDDKPHWDASVQTEVTVFVKPHSLQFGAFSVDSHVLDIELTEGLEFETYGMSLFSTAGDIVGREIERFTAHEMFVSTQKGSITGNWSLPAVIVLRTGIVSWLVEGGPIDVDLIPKRWSSGPNTDGALTVSTTRGDVAIRMPLEEETLSLRNMKINVYSQLGSICGTFVTGGYTSLTTVAGSIDATLLPYFALPDVSSIVSSAGPGDTNIRVLPPIIDSYYGINPLLNTRSEHSSTSGALNLQYTRQWVGAALGLSETGDVSASGAYFRTIGQWKHMVVARTDDVIASRLDFTLLPELESW